MATQLYSVSALVAYLQLTLDSDPLLADLWITGEVANASTSAVGHSYFSLREEGASFRCVLFSRYPGSDNLTNGAQVNVHGRVNMYVARGEIQLTADMVQPAGAGLLAAEFELLKAKLDAEGLFDESRKRSLPSLPRRIGVVTSETGAVFHDIVQTLTRRYPLAEVILSPALVQGDAAPNQIAVAIQTLNNLKEIDVIIVGRGGGSLEDLAAFNSEKVARAIHASRIPVISAVGHETDFTIADWVADARAPTPTAAAELVAPDFRTLMAETHSLVGRASAAVQSLSHNYALALNDVVGALSLTLPNTNGLRQGIDDLLAKAGLILTGLVGGRRAELAGEASALEALSPLAVLGRGYAALEATDGTRITRASSVSPGQTIHATLLDGTLVVQMKRAIKGISSVKEQAQDPAQETKREKAETEQDVIGPREDVSQPTLL